MNDSAKITLVIDQQLSSPTWVVVLGHDDPVYVSKAPELGDELELQGIGKTKVEEVERWEDGDSARDISVGVTPWEGTDDELEAYVERMCNEGWFEYDRQRARDAPVCEDDEEDD